MSIWLAQPVGTNVTALRNLFSLVVSGGVRPSRSSWISAVRLVGLVCVGTGGLDCIATVTFLGIPFDVFKPG